MNDIKESPSSNEESGYKNEYSNGMLDSGTAAVASSPGKIFLILGLLLAFIAFVIFIIYGDDENNVAEKIEEAPAIASERSFEAPPPPPVIPPAPLPRLAEPTVVAPPPPVPDLPIITQEDEAANAAHQERLRSGMMVLTGGSDNKVQSNKNEQSNFVGSSNDSNAGFARNVIAAQTDAPKVKAKKIRNLNSTIAQGKIISAVLESAIDTQLPGTIRAVVSHDVFPEASNTRIIPKGSRLIGTYNTSLFNGQSRVFIIWTRVIRPDGIDVMINSPGVDSLGRAGVKGFVDSRYGEIFSSAVLTSVLTIGLAKGAEEITGNSNSTTTTDSNGATTRNSSPTSDATLQALTNIGGAAQSIVADMLDIRKTVEIDQGTRINVMVNQDLIFPDNITNKLQFIQ